MIQNIHANSTLTPPKTRLLLIRFAYSPTNSIFLLGRLIFSKSINTHLDNIYIYVHCRKLYNLFVCPLETSIKLSLLLA
jgi:hypothetical protein